MGGRSADPDRRPASTCLSLPNRTERGPGCPRTTADGAPDVGNEMYGSAVFLSGRRRADNGAVAALGPDIQHGAPAGSLMSPSRIDDAARSMREGGYSGETGLSGLEAWS